MIRETDRYYLNREEPVRSCLLALRKIILSHEPKITETLKWGLPCFCYKKKMFCFLNTMKKTNEPYLLLVEGRYLDHPLLEKGSRSRMKILRVNPHKDIPIEIIQTILSDALDLYKNGIIKIKQ